MAMKWCVFFFLNGDVVEFFLVNIDCLIEGLVLDDCLVWWVC